jgi:hypothetical protein
MVPRNNDISKPVNLGEITVTVDDATVHLVGMINELSAKFDKQLELVNSSITELAKEVQDIKKKMAHDQTQFEKEQNKK